MSLRRSNSFLVNAAGTGCLSLVKTLASSSSWTRTGKDASQDLHNAVLTAIQHGRKNLIHHFLDTGTMTLTSTRPHNASLSKNPFGIATLSGRREIVNFLLSRGAALDSQTLAWAILDRDPIVLVHHDEIGRPDTAAPEYHMVRYLIDLGAPVTFDSLDACDRQATWVNRYFYRGGQFEYEMADRIRIVVRVADEMKMRFGLVPLTVKVVPLHVKTVLRMILNGKLEVCEADKIVAKEVMGWVNAMRREERMGGMSV